ncbi:MAG: V-type ATPase subunit [Oscillospiraceae bacterium]|nr:V-type ATPase subunit [Oscillospiraceae bacterium]
MARKPKDTDYLFLSASIRSRERELLTRSHVDRMLHAATVAESAQVLNELGYPPFDPGSETGLNEAIAQVRSTMFHELEQQMPDKGILDVFKLKYDYHNLKTIIKSRGGDVRHLLLDAGRVRAEEMDAKFRQTGKWDFLPPVPAAAAQEAARVLAETGDPQRSDFVLDRAYFSELLTMAKATGCEFLIAYVRTLIDAANLRSAVRTLRMHRAGTFLQQVLFEGGAVSVSRILAGVNDGVAELYRATPLARAAELGQEAVSGGSLTAFEKACDNAVLARAAASRSVPFGPEVPIGYVVARENDFTSARIILSGRLAGLDADTIRERLRDSYV